MKMLYILIAVALLLVAYGCHNLRSKKKDDAGQTVASDSTENPYEGLRNMAFEITPQQLDLELSPDKTEIFGVIMDWDLGDGIATLVTLKTGDASMYLSSGGGVIGGGQHESVKKSVSSFLSVADVNLRKATKANDRSLPGKNMVKFYFLTNTGRYTVQESVTNFDKNKSPLLSLFEKANEVITDLRLAAEK